MAGDTEPRAVTAALSSPAFVTRGGGAAMHAATRHVERWAPEATASRVRPLRSLGFVDRLVAPWMETAQRSPSLRMFTQVVSSGPGERQGGAVSWVFPRPWYQDELDWMAAARAQRQDRAMLTTRGTYVAPGAPRELVAPGVSLAPVGVAPSFSAGDVAQQYSPLVPFAAASAAQLMAQLVAPTAAPARMSPGLRAVLANVLERATIAPEPTRTSMHAPELVTPPAPRAVEPGAVASATRYAEQVAAQQQQLVEIQRIAQRAAAREIAARDVTARASEPARVTPAALDSPGSGARSDVQSRGESIESPGFAGARSDAQRRGESIESPVSAEARDAQRREAERAAEASSAERRRIEERIAQRLAERSGQPTRVPQLHEQARAQAASDARAPEIPAAAAAVARSRVPAEVIAAIGALPAQLAQTLGAHPERAMQTIDELATTLRAAELVSRSVASGAVFEPTRGPRLAMPAGLGGLVAAIDHARPIATAPMVRVTPPGAATAPMPRFADPRAVRMPAPAWLSPAPTMSALAASSATPPVALSHVAWSDRWLARFAGAAPASLDAFAHVTPRDARLLGIASAAPHGVFVAPRAEGRVAPGVLGGPAAFAREAVTSVLRGDVGVRPITPIESVARRGEPLESPGSVAARVDAQRRGDPIQPPVVRFDDDAETPDDVFAAIAQAVTRGRAPAPAPSRATPAAEPVLARHSVADDIVRSAPTVAGAGLSAQLASSPFAPALRHLIPLAAAPRFDVRALFGGPIAAGYLAGMFAAPAAEIGIDAPLRERAAADWDASYVAPEAPEEAGEAIAAPAASYALTTLRSSLLSWDELAPMVVTRAAGVDVAGAAPVGAADFGGAAMAGPTASLGGLAGAMPARAMIDAMAMPMLGDVMSPAGVPQGQGVALGASAGAPEPLFTAPGAIAMQAHRWGVAQERSSADLALDFVTPELVLAARVYGLGPAEAAQAARLAIAGPGQLTAMASTVDRIFVQAMAIEADRRDRLAVTTAYPQRIGPRDATGAMAPATTPSTTAAAIEATTATPAAMPATPSAAMPAAPSAMPATPSAPMADAALSRMLESRSVAFGVERRAPRGAFLWPSATVAALGLNAAAPDGALSMSVAALEMLAAQAVAELGTYASIADLADVAGAPTPAVAGGETGAAAAIAGATGPAAAIAGTPTPLVAPRAGVRVEPTEHDVLESAIALVPMARRARFEALYLALGESPAARSWSPAARAARALALAGRGPDAPATARERAATAWDVLPVVFGDAALAAGRDLHGEVVAPRAGRSRAASPGSTARDTVDVDHAPGLGSLAWRAGEALGSYVAPAPPRADAPRTESRESGAVMRAPTAAQELVQTGRPAGRHGGGEVEIPPWFEAAARKMLEERSGVSDGISLAELTLVTSTSSNQIAASTRGVPSAAPAASAAAPHAGPGPSIQPADIDKIAFEVYRQILAMMDAARARNGESYL